MNSISVSIVYINEFDTCQYDRCQHNILII